MCHSASEQLMIILEFHIEEVLNVTNTAGSIEFCSFEMNFNNKESKGFDGNLPVDSFDSSFLVGDVKYN